MKQYLFLSLFLIFGISQVSGQTYCTTGGPTSAAWSELESVQLTGQTSTINYLWDCANTVTGLLNLTGTHSADLVIGNTYSVTVNYGSCSGNWTNVGTVYIDFDGNGTFDASEAIGTTPAPTTTPFSGTYTFTVPPGAAAGATRMRVIQNESSAAVPLDPCAPFTWGTMADFEIILVPSGPCTGATVTAAAASSGIVCVGDSVNLSATGVSFGTGTVYQWQSSPDSVNWANLAGPLTVNRNSGALTTTTYFRLQVTCGATTVASPGVKVEVTGTPLAGGTYTINSALATGGTNFTNFSDFTSAIFCGGVAGPVVVNVVAGSGPYVEHVLFDNINTTSTNTITINGNGETVSLNTPVGTAGLDRGVFVIESTSFITVDDLVIKADSGFTGVGVALLISGASSDITVKNSTIEYNLASLNFNSTAVLISSNPTSMSAGGPTVANTITLEDNTIIGGYNGISLQGSSNANRGNGSVIQGNIVRDYYLYGLYSRNQNNLTVDRNDFSRPNRTSLTSFYGMYFVGEHAGAMITKNSVHDPFVASKNTSLIYALYAQNANGTAANPNHVINNRFYNLENNGTLYGIWNSGSSHWNYYHNSVDINHPAANITGTFNGTAGFYVSGASDSISFINNIVNVIRGGTSFKRAIFLEGTGTRFINNNGYFVDMNQPVAEFSNGFATFAAYQTGNTAGHDTNSVFDFPDFVSAATGLLRPASGAMNDLGQNLLSIVPTDFLDSARTATPDPGAFEFDPPPCPRPSTNLIGISDTSATIGWTSGIAGGTYEIEWGPAGFNRGTGFMQTLTQDSVQLNGLPPGTCYDIYVRLNCTSVGGGFSPWSLLYTFCTEVCDTAQSCLYTFRMTDSFGDGWNGNTMTISQSGIPVATIGSTFTTGAGPVDVTVRLCAGAFDLTWNTGGSFANEVGIEVIDPFSNSVFSMPFNSQGLQGTSIFTGVALCGVITCLPPTGFAFSGATDSSGTFTFTPGGGLATGIEVGPVGFTPGTGITTFVTGSPATISGLTPNTQYQAYILDTCIDGSSSPAIGPVNFSTACLAASMPYFEDYSIWPNTCWTYSTGNFEWEHYTTGGVNHAQARFWNFPATTPAATMTSVPITITTDAQVRYTWSRNTSTFYPDSMFVLARISGSSTWDTLKVFADPNFGVPNAGNTLPAPVADFQEEIHFLPSSYVGNAAEIRFVAKSGFGPNVYLDFFSVEAAPLCPNPTGFAATNIGSSSVDLNWTQTGAVSNWNIEWGPQGFTPGTGAGTIVPASTNPFTLTGLPSDSCLDIYIQADCTGSNNGTSSRVGPITICTPKEFDAALNFFNSPASYGCGSSATNVELAITNLGTAPITSLPLTVEITGDITQTLNFTYSGNLTTGNSVNVVVGTINAAGGGAVSMTAYGSLPNDQDASNDSIVNYQVVFIPEEPQADTASACAGTQNTELIAAHYPGIVYSWFNTPSGGASLHSGDTLSIPTPTANTTYYVEYESFATSSVFGYTGGDIASDFGFTDATSSSTCPGTITVTIPTGVTITGVDIAYDFEAANGAWMSEQRSELRCITTGLNEGVLDAGTGLGGVYSYNRTGLTIANGVATSPQLVFELHAGRTWGGSGCDASFNKILANSIQLTVHYQGTPCSSIRVPVFVEVGDQPTADFNAVLAGSTVTFTNTSLDYDSLYWNFAGQGNSSDPNPVFTFTSGGSQQVCLYAFNDCGIDTMCQTISSIATENFLMQESLRVFPNPSTSTFNIEFSLEGVQEVNMRVLSPTGQLIVEPSPVRTGGIFQTQIDLSGLAKGIYLLQVQTENGLATRRLNLL